MLTWDEEIVRPTGRTLVNNVIIVRSESTDRYLEVVELVIGRSRGSYSCNVEIVKKIHAVPIALLQYLRSSMRTHLLIAKLLQKRLAPVHPAGFYVATKLNLRNAP
jgi:hypothetical protein